MTFFFDFLRSFYTFKDIQNINLRGKILDKKPSFGHNQDGIFDLITRNIIDVMPVGIHIYHLEDDGRLVFDGANSAADKILDVDNSLFTGKTIEEAFPALAETEIPKRYREAASSGKIFRREEVIYNEDKIAGAFEVNAFQIEPGRMAAFFSDISDHKRGDEEIKFQNSLLKSQQEGSEDGILIVDRIGNILSCNKKFRLIWKIPEHLFLVDVNI